MTDLHIHTKFSPDSDARPESYVDTAMLCGADKLGFSEHYDLDYVYNKFEVVMTDVAASHKSVQSLRELYRGKIEILEGIEFGYSPLAEEEYAAFEKKYPFDYIINGVHVPEGETDCWFLEYFGGREKKERYRKYFETVSRSLDAKFDFQILGHLGYVARNAPYFDPRVYYAEFSDILDEILKKVVARGVALEINSNVRSAGSPFIPYLDILKRYRELGGERISLGSDAHQVRRLFDRFDLMREGLLSLGFTRTCFFRQKQIYFEELS